MCFMVLWQWLRDEGHGIQEFKVLAVILVVLPAVLSWVTSQWLLENRMATMQERMATIQSENDLLKSQTAATADWQGPLPEYSFGETSLLVYNSSEIWITQDVAQSVSLDWGRMADVDAYAVLRMSADGESAWVQGRVRNLTDGEVVATTDRHNGSVTITRFLLPRATVAKTYEMQIRGENAGLFGKVVLVSLSR